MPDGSTVTILDGSCVVQDDRIAFGLFGGSGLFCVAGDSLPSHSTAEADMTLGALLVIGQLSLGHTTRHDTFDACYHISRRRGSDTLRYGMVCRCWVLRSGGSRRIGTCSLCRTTCCTRLEPSGSVGRHHRSCARHRRHGVYRSRSRCGVWFACIPSSRRRVLGDRLFTSIVPLIAVGALSWSRRTKRQR